MPIVFDNHSEFLDWFGGPIEKALQANQEVHSGLLRKLHEILRPFVLRRLKKDVEKQLPEKKEVIIKCELSRR
jgi:E1A-binding protein p400